MPEPRRGAPRWSDADPANDDEELPPWAGLAIEPRWADQQERPSRPGRPSRPDQPGPPGGQGGDAAADAPGRRPRGRLAAARARKTRRSLVLWGSVLAVAVVIAGGVWQLTRGASGTAPLPDQIVTTFLPGEFQTVPNTCTAVSTATLDQYLPGTRTKVVPSSLNGQSDSLCDWTLDARPVYRLLDVEAQAYAPNGLASGNGSATFAAIDAYRQALAEKTRPPKASHLPKAAVTTMHGFGTAAFSALQVTTAGGDTTDLLTVVIRDRNVLVTVVLEGLDHSSKGGYGPVSAAQLKAGALAVARDILAQVK
ncbi:MAG TPA: hypothetical protein VGA04_06190 [Streptosporangiaceae bacterium]